MKDPLLIITAFAVTVLVGIYAILFAVFFHFVVKLW